MSPEAQFLLLLATILFAPILIVVDQRLRRPHPQPRPQPQGDPEMSKVTDAFAAYVAFRDEKEANAVTDAVEAERASHQAEVDTAVDEAETADAAVIEAATAPPPPLG